MTASDKRTLIITVGGGAAAAVLGALLKEWLDARGAFQAVRRTAGTSGPDDGLRGG